MKSVDAVIETNGGFTGPRIPKFEGEVVFSELNTESPKKRRLNVRIKPYEPSKQIKGFVFDNVHDGPKVGERVRVYYKAHSAYLNSVKAIENLDSENRVIFRALLDSNYSFVKNPFN